MRWIRFAIFVLVVTILQTGLVKVFAVKNVKPDLLLILLVFFAIYNNTRDAVISSFTIGFAADLIGSTMGPGIIGFGLFGTLLAYLHRIVAIRKMPYQALVIFIICFLSGILIHLLMLIKGKTFSFDTCMILFWTSVYSGLVGPFLFFPSAWWMGIRMDRFGQR